MSEPIEPNQQPGESPSDPERAVPFVLQDPMIRFDARVLDPATAVRVPGGEAPSPTVYVGDTLLVTAGDPDDGRDLLTVLDEAVKASGLPLQWVREDPFEDNDNPDHDARARLLRMAAERKLPLVFPVRFEPTADGPAAAVDVWPLLQSIRYTGRPEAGDDRVARLNQSIGLNHLMSSAAVIGGNPFMRGTAAIYGDPFMRGTAAVSGNPFMRGTAAGTASYSFAGSGGRGPVSVVLSPPIRSSEVEATIPHAVVLDTGVGRHPWFDAQAVRAGLVIDDPADPNAPTMWIGLDPSDAKNQRTDPEGLGAIADPLTGLLASHAGHGTFISGLLRQSCPEAEICAVRVMDSDGVVPELTLTDVLTGLGIVQTERKPFIDAAVLSLGYYSETADDVSYTAGLKTLILALSSRGMAMFCAAGNDSTDRRSYPAAFADDPAFRDGAHLPMASVAALNPDSSVALFSNDGDWVNSEAPGANLVSTAPTSAQGAWAQDVSLEGPGGRPRGTIDPDDFASGFCTWSGTSFAAPVLAGRYLRRLTFKGPADSVEERLPLLGIGRPTPNN